VPPEFDPDEPAPAEIFRYRIDIDHLTATGNLPESLTLLPDRVRLTEPDGSPLSRQLRHMQGATFTPWGDLVILNGFIDDSSTTDRGGIHIFRPVGASRNATEFSLVEESVNETGLGGFRFAYDGVDDDEEPEGIDWWNRGPDSSPAAAGGQLHAEMVDNTQFFNGETDPDDLLLQALLRRLLLPTRLRSRRPCNQCRGGPARHRPARRRQRRRRVERRRRSEHARDRSALARQRRRRDPGRT
jgi:hypothetical protein